MQWSGHSVLLLMIGITLFQQIEKMHLILQKLFSLSSAMPSLLLPDWVKSQTAQLCQNSGNSEWVPKQNLLVSSQLYSHKMLNEWDTSGSWGSQLGIAALGFSTKIPPDFNFMPSSPFFRQSPKWYSWHSCQNISSIEASLFLSSLKMAYTYLTEKSEQIISVRAFLRANMIIHLLNNNSVNIYSQRISSLCSNHTVLFSDQIWSRCAIDFHNVICIQYPTGILEPTSEHLCASLSHGTYSLWQILCWLAVS